MAVPTELLGSDGKPLPAPPPKPPGFWQRRIRFLGKSKQGVIALSVVIVASLTFIVAVLSNLDSIVEHWQKWNADPAAAISFPVLATTSDGVYLEVDRDEQGEFPLEVTPFSFHPDAKPSYAGTLQSTYQFGFQANPLIEENRVTYLDPIFNVVVRNESDGNQVLSAIGVRLVSRKQRMTADLHKYISVPIPVSQVSIDLHDVNPGDVRLVDIEPVALGPQGFACRKGDAENRHPPNCACCAVRFRG